MRTTFLLIVLVSVAVAGGIFWFGKDISMAPVVEDVSPSIVFVNAAGESVSVLFEVDNDTLILSGAGYENVVLTQIVTPSGVHYINEELGLDLWSEDGEIMLSQGGVEIFSGVMQEDISAEDAEDASEESDVSDVSDAPSSIITLTEESLTANAWTWKETVMNNDEVITPKEKGAFVVTFSTDGRVSGTTDCNGFGGSYTLTEDGSLSFGSFVSTLMFCEGSQEGIFTGALADVQSGFTTGSGELVLALPFDSGSIIFTAGE